MKWTLLRGNKVNNHLLLFPVNLNLRRIKSHGTGRTWWTLRATRWAASAHLGFYAKWTQVWRKGLSLGGQGEDLMIHQVYFSTQGIFNGLRTWMHNIKWFSDFLSLTSAWLLTLHSLPDFWARERKDYSRRINFKRKREKQNVVYTYNGLLFSYAKEWDSDTRWMSLENIMLSDKHYWARHQRTNIPWFHLFEISRMGKFIETECRLEVTRSWEKWGVHYCLMGTEFPFGVVKNFVNSGDGYSTLWTHLLLPNMVHLQWL